ncbi:MAG: hypothetical protein AB1555_07180 [Nitrospirota bacterium]
MSKGKRAALPRVLGFTVVLSASSLGWAQTFNSGSTGALGAFNPTANTTVILPPDGILNYTTVTIPSGVTVTFQRNTANTPVTLLATGDVTIAGAVRVDGTNGPSQGGIAAPGGPGGFPGGVGGAVTITGYAPVGGAGPGGGAPGDSTASSNATYGAPISFASLVPLVGGSGGGGGVASTLSAAGGGGGGGAIVIASSTKITVTGMITANGGGGATSAAGTSFNAGGGSGGAIRLVAPQVTGAGQLQATGGPGTPTGVPAGSGRIRIESATGTFTGISNPTASVSTTLGPVTPASTPPLVNLPTLTITSVGSIAAPVTPTGAYTVADMSLPQGTTNPVPVLLTASGLPFPTPFTIKVIPQLSGPTTVTGTLTGSTATALVTLPIGEVTQLVAFASFTVPTQSAALWPLIDGEPVEQVLIAAAFGEPATVTFRTRSGKTAQATETWVQGR